MLRNAKPIDISTSSAVELTVQDISKSNSYDKHEGQNPTAKREAKAGSANAVPPTKIWFLDGVRGLAALMVCTSHSKEYMADIDLGAIAVDAFFVLSSFLLTWLFMKKSIRLLAQGASVRKWTFTFVDYFSKRFCRVYPLFALTSIVIWLLPAEAKKRYYLIQKPKDFDLYKVLVHVRVRLPLLRILDATTRDHVLFLHPGLCVWRARIASFLVHTVLPCLLLGHR